MTDLRKAAEMALDALEVLSKNELPKKGAAKAVLDESVIPALRQALAQPDSNCNGMPVYEGPLSKSQALAQGETVTWSKIDDPNKWDVDAVNISQERVDETAKREHEPVVWMNKYGHVASFQNEEYKDPLYAAPPKREWVGLTEEELDEAMEYWSDDSRSTYGGAIIADGEYVNMRDTWRYIEAKLKEKNT